MRRVMEPSNPDDHLLERILSRENMQRAWKRVQANKGAPGIDGLSIEGSPLGQYPSIAPDRHLSTLTRTARGDPQGYGWYPPSGDSHRARPADPASYCTGPCADLRSRFLGLQLWIPAGTLGTGRGQKGQGAHSRRIPHSRRLGSLQVFRHRCPRRAYAQGGATGAGQKSASPHREVPPGRSGDQRSSSAYPTGCAPGRPAFTPSSPTSFSMTWTKSLSIVATGSSVTLTTSLFW